MDNNSIDAYSDLTRELHISADGKISVSRRGLSRLCGVELYSIQHLLQNTLADQQKGVKISEAYAGQSFTPDQEIPDLLAAEIVFHYALLGRELAIKSLKAFTAIGFRTWGQKLLGWDSLQASPTPELKRLELILTIADRHGVELAALSLGGRLPDPTSPAPSQPQACEDASASYNPSQKSQLKAKAWDEILETRDRWAAQNGDNVFGSDLLFSQAYNELRIYIGEWVYEIVPHICRSTVARRRLRKEHNITPPERKGRPPLMETQFPAIAAFITECLQIAPDMGCAEVIHRVQYEFDSNQQPSAATIRRYYNKKHRQKQQ